MRIKHLFIAAIFVPVCAWASPPIDLKALAHQIDRNDTAALQAVTHNAHKIFAAGLRVSPPTTAYCSDETVGTRSAGCYLIATFTLAKDLNNPACGMPGTWYAPLNAPNDWQPESGIARLISTSTASALRAMATEDCSP